MLVLALRHLWRPPTGALPALLMAISTAPTPARAQNEPRSRPLGPDSARRTHATDTLRLTRRAAIAQALTHNPTLQVAQEQVAEARARVVQGFALPEPSFSAAVLGQPGLIRPHSATETDLALGITIPFPQKIILRGQAAEGDFGNVDQQYILQRQVITRQTSQAYDSLLVALRHREDLQVARQLAEDFLKKTQARFNAGTAPKLDVIKAQVGVAQAENDLIANERGIANARAALNRLLGRTLGASIAPADSLTVPAVPLDVERLERIALTSRPELRALARQRQGARAATQLAQQYFLPDLSLSVSHNYVYGAVPTYATAIGIGVPLFFWQHQRGEVAEARHHELELTASYRDLTAQVGQDLRNAYATASTSLRQVLFLRDQLVPSAQEQYRITSTSYTLGGSSALEVIDAQRTLLDAKNQFVAALGALNDAVADLERATGVSLDSTATELPHD